MNSEDLEKKASEEKYQIRKQRIDTYTKEMNDLLEKGDIRALNYTMGWLAFLEDLD